MLNQTTSPELQADNLLANKARILARGAPALIETLGDAVELIELLMGNNKKAISSQTRAANEGRIQKLLAMIKEIVAALKQIEEEDDDPAEAIDAMLRHQKNKPS